MSEPEQLPLRDDLRGQSPYGAPQLHVPVLLNVNENPYPPSDAMVADVVEAVALATRGLNRYPDREAWKLREDLAEYLYADARVRLVREQLWAANGSNEIMLQLLQAFGGPGRLAIGFSPTYSMYPDYCRDTFTTYVQVPRAIDFEIDIKAATAGILEHQPSVVLVASPNNPTGTAVSLESIEEILAVATGIVIVDEAYAEFRRPGTPSALELLEGNERLVVTRTMSKAFGLAGARIGYLAASPRVVDAVRLVRLPYHLSAITQAVGRTALRHTVEQQAQVAILRTERDLLEKWLGSRGHETAHSDANFVLFGVFSDRHAVWQGLLDRGVLIRETGPDGWLRVSIGTPEENAAFRAALEEVTT